MKLVWIIGPQAVGKMTVGHALEKQTGLTLFHNHMTIDLLEPLFGFSPELMELSEAFRRQIFKKFLHTENDGLIFTFMWAFNEEADWQFVKEIYELFTSHGADVYFVELEASVDTRLARNHSPHRLAHKPTKRNIEQSEAHLLQSIDKYRLQSEPGEIPYPNYIRINNENLAPEDVATLICKQFAF